MGADSLHPGPFDDSGSDGSHQPLPSQIATVTTVGVYSLIIGVLLMGVSFLTNPIPDPSFPWATLPESLRVAYTQPRIEHWPVTYTVGLWLVVFTLPLVLLAAYQRYESTFSFRPSAWLAVLPVTVMLAFTTYCRFFWPKLQPPTWNAPSYTLVCWGYCSTYDPLWSNLAYAVAVFGVGATYPCLS
jgi:cellulose synthase/poly-beta-1,6-N-acetylglucosamine synthase-like glycosyltransferase